MAKRTTAALAAALLVIAIAIVPAAGNGVDVSNFTTGGRISTPLGWGTITHRNFVETPSGRWQITLHGKLDSEKKHPDQAVRWNESTWGAYCRAKGGESIHAVINPNGTIHMTCKGKQ